MIRRADVDKWLRLLKKRKFDPGLAEYWARHARPYVQLAPTKIRDEDNLPPRSSKLRGEPDLPVGMTWPIRPPYPESKLNSEHAIAREERPLDFIAQINLKDIAKVGCDLPLPTSGLLLFFYDSEFLPFGDPGEAVGWRVIYVSEDTATERQSNPSEQFPVASLRFKASESLPCYDWLEEQFRGDSRYSEEMLSKERDKLTEGDHERGSTCDGHTFGGWYNPVQSTMEWECEMASNGIASSYPDFGAIYNNPDTKKSFLDWRLLLQINTDYDMRFMWYDEGAIYFFCREQDIAEQRFDRAWVILQTF